MALAAILPPDASAEIKEYQMRRMLMLKTDCQVVDLDVSHLDDVARVGADSDRFIATCSNVSHYPDGVEILCPDTEDETDCRILTEKRKFPHLHLPEP